tara:strand:+ start:81 stop:404 length:324 start_codon:yes stop_codon:yes gene_type:complete
MSEAVRLLGFGLTGAFIIVSYFAAIILAFVWLRVREAAASPAGQFHKFKSSCGGSHTPAVEGAGCQGLAVEATGLNISSVDSCRCAAGQASGAGCGSRYCMTRVDQS